MPQKLFVSSHIETPLYQAKWNIFQVSAVFLLWQGDSQAWLSFGHLSIWKLFLIFWYYLTSLDLKTWAHTGPSSPFSCLIYHQVSEVTFHVLCLYKAFLVAQNGKETAGNAGDPGSIPGLGRSPGVGNASHSIILSWRIPWKEGSAGLQSMGLQRVGHDWANNTSCLYTPVQPLPWDHLIFKLKHLQVLHPATISHVTWFWVSMPWMCLGLSTSTPNLNRATQAWSAQGNKKRSWWTWWRRAWVLQPSDLDLDLSSVWPCVRDFSEPQMLVWKREWKQYLPHRVITRIKLALAWKVCTGNAQVILAITTPSS